VHASLVFFHRALGSKHGRATDAADVVPLCNHFLLLEKVSLPIHPELLFNAIVLITLLDDLFGFLPVNEDALDVPLILAFKVLNTH
jgi:hypothetical protein